MTVSDENEIDNVPSREEIHEISAAELEEIANAPVVYDDVDADDDYPDDAEMDPDGVEEVEETEVTPENWETFLPVAGAPSAPPGVGGFELLSAPFQSPVEAGQTALGEPTTESGLIIPTQPVINQIVGANGLLTPVGQAQWDQPAPDPQFGFEP